MWTQVQVWASVDTGAAVDVHVSALATPLRWAPPGPGLRLVTAGMWWMTQPAEGGRHLAPIAHGLGDRSPPVSMRTPGEWARGRGQLWPTPRSLHPSSQSTGGEGLAPASRGLTWIWAFPAPRVSGPGWPSAPTGR